MARVTVEDCIKALPNAFELVLVGRQRARELDAGAPPTIDADCDKNAVIALREIAAGTVDLDRLREELVQGFQQLQPEEATPDDELDELHFELTDPMDEAASDNEELEFDGDAPAPEANAGALREEALEKNEST